MACGCGYRKRLREDRDVRRAIKTHYLDYCATTPSDPRTLGAFERACRANWANPSSAHACGIAAAERLDEYRLIVAKAFASSADGLSFCASGSEALHAGIWGLAARYPKLRFVTTATEHSSVRAPLRLLRSLGRDVRECRVDGDGRIDPDHLRGLIRAPDIDSETKNIPRTVLIYSPVNHETGTVQNVRVIWNTLIEADALAFIDAVQTAPRLQAADWAPYAHLFAVSAHKLYAPKGSACLWKAPELKLRPFRYGGGQENGLFPGTENVPGIAAFAEAAKILAENLKNERMMMNALERDFFTACEQRGVPVEKESAGDHAPGVFCLSFPWISDMEEFMTGLARKGVCVSRFSACSDRADGPSKTLLAMGRTKERAKRSLRIGLGRFSAREDVIALARSLEDSFKTATSPPVPTP
ncbi:MAG: aminotransferase class V-fold PLP-dependent enzyme [Treponemataceae bacterium]